MSPARLPPPKKISLFDLVKLLCFFWITFVQNFIFGRDMSPLNWLNNFQIKFTKYDFVTNYRTYKYARIVFFSIELVICFFPPGSHTDPHDHPNAVNINFVLTGGPILERKFRIRNGKPRIIEEKKLRPGKFSVIMPNQVHDMEVSSFFKQGSITLNFHVPARDEILIENFHKKRGRFK
jgi:hypothetical protein